MIAFLIMHKNENISLWSNGSVVVCLVTSDPIKVFHETWCEQDHLGALQPLYTSIHF
jgi:hypothetical protein